MKQNEIITKIKEVFPSSEISAIDDKQFSVKIKDTDAIRVLSYMQTIEFRQLALITAVDWIDRGVFEVVYNLFSYNHIQQVLIKTEIKRENPKIQSVATLFETAQMYERDTHEFFGINFIGNNDLRPLILHNWRDIPPMRKDFDSEMYSDKLYGNFKKEKKI